MLENFQLAAIVRQGTQVQLLRIPMHQDLQDTLANNWQDQLDAFLDDAQEVEFDVGYQPEEHELFALRGFEPPEWLANETSATVADLNSIDEDLALGASIRGIVGFARDVDGEELVLFQNFSRSHIVKPGKFLFLKNGTYKTTERPGLTLENRLSAVYRCAEAKLLFRNFRTVNTFLPLGDFYEEASEHEIRQVLSHERLSPVNVDAIAIGSNQWMRKRFAMLRDSGVLEQFTAKQIRARSTGYDVNIQIQKGKVVFPEDRFAAKKLLQFLNEELFRGSITETVYETNSKRKAD